MLLFGAQATTSNAFFEASFLRVKQSKRHILTDTCGFLIFILVHIGNIQDRDGAAGVLKAVGKRFPWLRHVFADGGYSGGKLRAAFDGQGPWTIEIIKRSEKVRIQRRSSVADRRALGG